MSPFDAAATCRLTAAAMCHVRAIALRQSGCHAPLYDRYHAKIAWYKRFAGAISTARDKVTGEIIQAGSINGLCSQLIGFGGQFGFSATPAHLSTLSARLPWTCMPLRLKPELGNKAMLTLWGAASEGRELSIKGAFQVGNAIFADRALLDRD